MLTPGQELSQGPSKKKPDYTPKPRNGMQKLASFEFSHLLPVWYSKEIRPGTIPGFAVDVGQQKGPVSTPELVSWSRTAMPNWTRLDPECVDVLLVSVDAVQICQATTSYAWSGVPSQVMKGLDISPGNGSSPLGVPDSP